MIYIVLASGKNTCSSETRHGHGRRPRHKEDAPWIQEDVPPIMAQLEWLNGLSRTEKNLIIIASPMKTNDRPHKRGHIGNKLE
jgi:hypothetical protein